MRHAPWALVLLGIVGAGAAGPSPLAPLACADPCPVGGLVVGGFVPPVAVVRSGASVSWFGLDAVAHVNEEGLTLGEEDTCFRASYAGAVSAEVAFRLEGAGVVAIQGGEERPCPTAHAAPEGVLVPYVCVVHAATMRGALLVVP